MERKTQKNGLINLLALVLLGAAALTLARLRNSLAGMMDAIFLGIGALVAAVSWFQMRLEEREHLEKLEFEELAKSAASSALFNASETEVFPAQRSREQFERFFVPAFTVLLFLLQAGGSWLLWRWLQTTIPDKLTDPTTPMALFGVFALILFLLGKYSTGIARIEQVRLLRPAASYLLLNAYLAACVAGALIFVLFDFPQADLYMARALVILLMLTSIETLINLILEMYRPRVKGKVERPMYESRVVSLLGQPEGLITTAAQTLDYQFGFKVSETWAYGLVEKYLPWLIVCQCAALLVSTCIVFIEVGEQGILEHNGNPVAVLTPGAHLKLPWPIDRVYRYETERIQTINIGFVPNEVSSAGDVVLWTVPHTKEENFLVATRDTTHAENATPPVSLLTISIPVQFQITNLTAWVYNNEDPVNLLEDIAWREVVHYFVSVDLQEVMAQGRWDASQALRDHIQADVNQYKMGANIVFVGLQDIHPPVKVAPDYEKVVGAIQTKQANILNASAYAIFATNTAGWQSFKTLSVANADLHQREVDALSRAALFTNQIPAYLASPSVYKQRAYYETLARSVTNAPIYLQLATNTSDVLILDLEEKISRQLEDEAELPTPKSRPTNSIP